MPLEKRKVYLFTESGILFDSFKTVTAFLKHYPVSKDMFYQLVNKKIMLKEKYYISYENDFNSKTLAKKSNIKAELTVDNIEILRNYRDMLILNKNFSGENRKKAIEIKQEIINLTKTIQCQNF